MLLFERPPRLTVFGIGTRLFLSLLANDAFGGMNGAAVRKDFIEMCGEQLCGDRQEEG